MPLFIGFPPYLPLAPSNFFQTFFGLLCVSNKGAKQRHLPMHIYIYTFLFIYKHKEHKYICIGLYINIIHFKIIYKYCWTIYICVLTSSPIIPLSTEKRARRGKNVAPNTETTQNDKREQTNDGQAAACLLSFFLYNTWHNYVLLYIKRNDMKRIECYNIWTMVAVRLAKLIACCLVYVVWCCHACVIAWCCTLIWRAVYSVIYWWNYKQSKRSNMNVFTENKYIILVYMH